MSRLSALFLTSLLVTSAFGYVDVGALPRPKALRGTRLSHSKKILAKIHNFENPSTNSHGQCQWNEADELCEVKPKTVADLLRKSGDDYGEYISLFWECKSKTTEEKCASRNGCVWFTDSKMCIFTEFAAGHDDSPCVVGAPKFFDLMAAGKRCAASTSATDCSGNFECFWLDADATCAADELQILYGFSSADLLAVVDERLDQRTKAFRESFDFERPDFDWKDVLKWDPPAGPACPKDVPEAACKFADLEGKYILPLIFYCANKYTGFRKIACSFDRLCTLKFRQFTCTLEDEETQIAVGKAITEMTESIDTKIDKEILKKDAACTEKTTHRRCIDDCIWERSEGNSPCSLSSKALFKMLTAPGETVAPDPICQFFEANGEADCEDIFDDDKCAAKSQCTIDSNGDCSATMKYILSTVFGGDGALGKSYQTIAEKCEDVTVKEKCDKAYTVSQ